jgi:iron complex outermembrane receptor protein
LTFDGIPLNDTGNYAIYSNQQIDPELIDAVDVNLGTTDVDSPTASATGGTDQRAYAQADQRNGRSRDRLGWASTISAAYFGLLDTGAIGPRGTRAYIAASCRE